MKAVCYLLLTATFCCTTSCASLAWPNRTTAAILDDPLSEDVTFTLDIFKTSGGKVRVKGRTNLPVGTVLMIGVAQKTEDGYSGVSRRRVNINHTFESADIGPTYGLEQGSYEVTVVVPGPNQQPTNVRRSLGSEGEFLTGPFVETIDGVVTVIFREEIKIGDHATRENTQLNENEETRKLRLKVCELLDALLSFKDSDEFKTYGFGDGGGFNHWMAAVDGLRDSNGTADELIPDRVRSAPGELLSLGLEYARTNGQDNQETEQKLFDLKGKIAFDDFDPDEITASQPAPATRTMAMAQSAEYNDPENDRTSEHIDPALTKPRIWRDASGQYSVKATFVRTDGQKIVLRKKDGSEITIDEESLSHNDRKVLKRTPRRAP